MIICADDVLSSIALPRPHLETISRSPLLPINGIEEPEVDEYAKLPSGLTSNSAASIEKGASMLDPILIDD